MTASVEPPRSAKSWQPLITGADAAEARKAIAAIAHDLLPESADNPQREVPATLANGAAGFALFFAYLAKQIPEQRYMDAAAAYWDQAIDQLAEVDMTPSLFNGFSGIAWMSQHLEERFFDWEDEKDEDAEDEDAEDENSDGEVDSTLLEIVSHRPWKYHYDLIIGLVGIGVYLLERLPRKTAAQGLEEIVQRLAELAEPTEDGHRWLTPPELLLQWQRDLAPKGYYNLGLAHGMPAVIGLLAAACRAGIAVDVARPLLEGGLNWFWSARLAEGRGSTFCSWLEKGGTDNHPSRLAWCYGDAGIAASLFAAARIVDSSVWEAEALKLAQVAAARPLERTGVVDSCLCHGTAGLLQIFNRLYQGSGDEACRQAARFWFDQTLASREPGQWVGGFWTMMPDGTSPSATPNFNKVAIADFLEGAAGVGLALLAAISEVPPDWDRALMISLRSVK